MSQNPRLHRGTLRLPDYDYTSAGGYHITLVTHERSCLFGEIPVDQMSLNSFGDIAREEWLRTPAIRPEIILDEFVIMPNHIHGIIFITESVGAHGRAPLRSANQILFRPPGSLGSFVAGFKSITTKRINILRATPGMPVWQRNYYEHIIRDEQDLNRIREYINNNPLQWETDPEYLSL
jgi:putative transposase